MNNFKMDTSWMSLPRATTEYENGLDKFLDFIFSTEGKNGQISCPCIDCSNQIWVDRRRLERISNVSGLLKATELHLLFPNHVKSYSKYAKQKCEKFYKR
uniref:Putative transposase-associated domain-containing protein n=1 Tax=Helianthus annuus TaxID=4232 RepID=A0A251UQF1_HELAN